MKWIEIITLQSNGDVQESLIPDLSNSFTEDRERSGLISIKIYRNPLIDTDVSIHLCWESTRVQQEGSAMGLRLAKALREIGLVYHSTWVEAPPLESRKVNLVFGEGVKNENRI